MTTQDMLDLLKQRTKITDQSKCLRELKVAYRWAVNEIYKSADGPALLVTVGEELPALLATTRDYDLESIIATAGGGTLLGLQTLWVRLPGDTKFTRLIPRDITSNDFVARDAQPATDPLIASGYPIFFAVTNYGQVRFAPALPTGAILRADYSRFGPEPDPITNPTQQDGTDLPSLFHDAIVHEATANLFLTLDDDRAIAWASKSLPTLNSAIYTAGKATRTQRPVETRPFTRSRRRGF